MFITLSYARHIIVHQTIIYKRTIIVRCTIIVRRTMYLHYRTPRTIIGCFFSLVHLAAQALTVLPDDVAPMACMITHSCMGEVRHLT